MDLYRIEKELQKTESKINLKYVNTFLDHALADFEKFTPNKREKSLRDELFTLSESLGDIDGDLHKRLQWTEKVMTVRCRL